MKYVKQMLNRAAKNLETFSHPRVSIAFENLDLEYVRVYNPSPDLGTEIIGKRLEDVLHDPAEVTRLTAIKREVLATGKPHHETATLSLAGKRPRTFDLNLEPTFDAAGQLDGLISVNIELTDLVQAREQLAAANARLVKLLGHAFDEEPRRVKR